MNRGTCSKNDAVVKWRIIVGRLFVCLWRFLKKFEATEAVEKFKTNFKLSEHHFDDSVCDGCFVCSCSLNLWRIR